MRERVPNIPATKSAARDRPGPYLYNVFSLLPLAPLMPPYLFIRGFRALSGFATMAPLPGSAKILPSPFPRQTPRKNFFFISLRSGGEAGLSERGRARTRTSNVNPGPGGAGGGCSSTDQFARNFSSTSSPPSLVSATARSRTAKTVV